MPNKEALHTKVYFLKFKLKTRSWDFAMPTMSEILGWSIDHPDHPLTGPLQDYELGKATFVCLRLQKHACNVSYRE